VTATARTPQSLNKPMYLIVNLAVGGKWPGDPDASTIFPASLHVQRIRAWRLEGEQELPQ
jgi:beta-glucanase (GH16 family)